MTRLIVRLLTASLAFSFGVFLDRVFLSRKPAEVPKVEERCDPSRVEVKTIFVGPPAPPPLEIFDIDIDSPPPSGTFYFLKTPEDFRDLEFLDLWCEVVEDGEIDGEGQIFARANGVSDAQRTLVFLINRRRVLLITESESGNGFGYRFDGEFVRHKNLHALADEGKPILRGTLTKTKNGRKVAESFVSLWLEILSHC